METAHITMKRDAQYVLLTMHDHATGDGSTWVLPHDAARQIAEQIIGADADATRIIGRLREMIDSITPHAMDRDDVSEFLNDIENILNGDA